MLDENIVELLSPPAALFPRQCTHSMTRIPSKRSHGFHSFPPHTITSTACHENLGSQRTPESVGIRFMHDLDPAAVVSG